MTKFSEKQTVELENKFTPISQILVENDDKTQKYLVTFGTILVKTEDELKPNYTFVFGKQTNPEEKDQTKFKFEEVFQKDLPKNIQELASMYYTGFNDGSSYVIKSKLIDRKLIKNKLGKIEKKINKTLEL